METRTLRTPLTVIAVFLLTIGIVSAASTCQTISTPNIKVVGITWGNSSRIISAAPGQMDVPLTVSLESYDTNCELENVVGTLNLYGGVTDFSGASSSVDYIQSIQPPSFFNMVFHLNIASNVSAGPYTTVTYPLVLEWDSLNGSTNVQQQLNIPVPIHGAANLTFQAQNPDVIAGKISNITIKVTNTGSGAASDIGTTISSTAGVSLLSQPPMIALLQPNASSTVSFNLYVAPSQAGNSQAGSSVVLNLNTHYINPYGYNTTLENNLGLFASVPSQSAVLVSVPNQTLKAGKIINTNLTITNQESDPLTNVSVVLTPQSPLSVIGSDDLNTILKIPSGASVNLPISLYVQSSTSAVATLDIALTYVLDNQAQSISRSISFLNPGYVNATIVSTTISPSTPTPGGVFSITSTLDNIGSQAAVAATVTPKPPSGSGIKVLGENTSFLGSIPIDTPTAFTVSFTTPASLRSGLYLIPVKLAYLNNLNQIQNETFYYNVSIGASAFSSNSVSRTGNGSARVFNSTAGAAYYYRRSSPNYLIYVVIGVVVVVVAVGGFYLYRRRKKEHEKGHEGKEHKENKAHAK